MIEAAGGLVVDDDGRIAVVHRPHREDWSLPKGKLDPGESFEDAAVREVHEETGVRARLVHELPEARYEVRGRAKRVRWWRMAVEAVEDRAPDGEVDELRWCTREEALALLTYEADRRLVERGA